MRREIAIEPKTYSEDETRYDLVAAALGYEERARHLFECHRFSAAYKVAWEFAENHVLSFEANKNHFSAAGFNIENSPDLPRRWIASALSDNSVQRRKACHVCVDISSLSRKRLAMWIEAFATAKSDFPIEVDFYYSAAKFVMPSENTAPNVCAGPVSSYFAGWALDPGFPTSLVLGLGYEPDRAIGAVEYLEPKEVVALEPISKEPRFTTAIVEANQQVMALKPQIVRYRVERPYETVMLLDAVLASLERRSRPILLPFGPKIFALSSLLVAKLHPTVAVWRVSPGAGEEPLQRYPNGEIFGLRAVFSVVGR